MGGKLLHLPGEVLQTGSKGENLKVTVTTNCKKPAEAMVPSLREGLNNCKSQVQAGRRSV